VTVSYDPTTDGCPPSAAANLTAAFTG
jgi:hypothetical protein